MISKVFENFIKEDTIKVKKKVKKQKQIITYTETYEKKEIKNTKKNGYCGRCSNHYGYGDNPREPTKCPHCVCIESDCRVSIMDRKRTVARYASSDVVRCYSCWYRWYHKKPFYKNVIGIEVSYSHDYPSSSSETEIISVPVKKPVVKNIEVEEEIEVEEKISITINQEVFPTEIKHSSFDTITIANLNLFNEKNAKDNYQNYFSDLPAIISESEITMNSNWYGVKSRNELKDNLNKETVIKETIKLNELDGFVFNEMIIDEKQVLTEFSDVVGFYPNVPAYIQGHPLDMYNAERKNIKNIDKSVTIFINLAIDSTFHQQHYYNRGVTIFSILEYLLNRNTKVNLVLLDATHIKGHVHVQRIEFQYRNLLQYLNLVYSLITSVSYYRLHLLENKIHYLKEKKFYHEWEKGNGYVLKNNDLKRVLSLDEDTLLIGNISEHQIKGINIEDDFDQLIATTNLHYKIEDEKNIEELILIPSVLKDVISKRRINKLIHITAEKNISSIEKFGLLSIIKLKKKEITFHQNDIFRLDLFPEAVCLSITKPNSKLFSVFKKRYPEIKYKVIELDPKFLYELKDHGKSIKRLFCDYNAAARDTKTSEDNIEVMFREEVRIKNSFFTRNNLSTYETTTDQAEILYFGDIPPQYILKIYDYNGD